VDRISFNAIEHEPWRGPPHETPAAFALHLWLQYENADEDMDPAVAFELAPYDREVYDALQEWAWSQDVDALSVEWQAALGRALGRKPPRKGKGATARRDARLRGIAAALGREYHLPRAQAVPGGPTTCAASILATLPGTPSEGQIANILSS